MVSLVLNCLTDFFYERRSVLIISFTFLLLHHTKYKLILEFLHKVFSSVVNSVNGHILYILQVIRYKTFLCVYIYSEWGFSYEHLVNEYYFILGSLICLQAFWISNQAIIFSIAQQNVDNIFALLLFFLSNAIIVFFRTTLQNKKCTVK